MESKGNKKSVSYNSTLMAPVKKPLVKRNRKDNESRDAKNLSVSLISQVNDDSLHTSMITTKSLKSPMRPRAAKSPIQKLIKSKDAKTD